MRRSHQALKALKETALVLGTLGLLSLVANWWVLDANNFFGLDDFDWFRQAQLSQGERVFTLLPQSVYNDRPVGLILIRILWRWFEWNHVAHHACLWTLHLVNAGLVYLVAGRLVSQVEVDETRKPFWAWIAAAIFVAWPASTEAPSWDASIFDLFGATLMLAFLAVALHQTNRRLLPWSSAMLLALLWIGLRTKETLIVSPFILLAIGGAAFIANRWRRTTVRFPDFAWVALGLCAVSILYYVLLRMADESGYGREPGHPYFLSFTPSVLGLNSLRYLALFFDFGIPSSPATMPAGGRWLYYILPVVIALVAIGRTVRRQGLAIALSIVLATMQLAPVLPMPNMQQRLYLYLPSAFAAIAIAETLAYLCRGFTRWQTAVRSFVAAALVSAMVWGAHGSAISIARNWWLGIGGENRRVFSRLRELPRFPAGARIAVVNVPGEMLAVNLFWQGDGEILKVLGSDPSVTVKIYEHEIPPGAAGPPPTHVIDYNGSAILLRPPSR